MVRRLLPAVCALLLLLPPQLAVADAFDDLFSEPDAAAGPRVRGEFGLLLYESFFADVAADLDQEDAFDNVIRALPHAAAEGENWRAMVSILATQRFQLGTSGLISAAEVEPWEMYGEWRTQEWEIAAGTMVTRWGRGAVSILDLPNPLDLSHGLSVEDEMARRPIPQLRYSWFGTSYSLHLLYNPFYREHKLASFDSDWSIVRIRAAGNLESLPIFRQSVQQQIYPGTKSLPTDDFIHGEAGAWWRGKTPGWDWGAYFFAGWDKIAYPHFSDSFLRYLRQTGKTATEVLKGLEVQEIVYFNPLYDQRPERTFYGGAEASTTWVGYTWRAELLAQSGMSVYREDLEFLRPPALSALIGADSFGSEDFVFSANLFVQGILTTESLYQSDPLNLGAMGAVHWKPEGWPVAMDLRAGLLFNDGSAWINPLLVWPFKPGHQLSVGVEFVEGMQDHLASNFSHNDAWMMRYRYQFLK